MHRNSPWQCKIDRMLCPKDENGRVCELNIIPTSPISACSLTNHIHTLKRTFDNPKRMRTTTCCALIIAEKNLAQVWLVEILTNQTAESACCFIRWTTTVVHRGIWKNISIIIYIGLNNSEEKFLLNFYWFKALTNQIPDKPTSNLRFLYSSFQDWE